MIEVVSVTARGEATGAARPACDAGKAAPVRAPRAGAVELDLDSGIFMRFDYRHTKVRVVNETLWQINAVAKKAANPKAKPLIGILLGSTSDWEIMKHAAETLKSLDIPFEAKALSAHRNPELVSEYARTAKSRGLRTIIAGAGMAAALPGVIASLTPLPVLGVPCGGAVLGGLDAVMSMVQMPGGVPVATFAVGRAGAVNAAIFAAALLALGDPKIAKRLDEFRAAQSSRVAELPAV
jgi:5-(carboxyamino)imidazole ribonucleotide mutase